ncbi:hypothetical protein Hdeb2414_s0325g00868441 [Helianthus debilis subsp. tardiflorus]
MAVPRGYGRFLQLVVTSNFCCPPSPLNRPGQFYNLSLKIMRFQAVSVLPTHVPGFLLPNRPRSPTINPSLPSIIKASLFPILHQFPIHRRLSMPYIQNEPYLISYGFSPTAIEEEFVNNMIS